MEKQKIKSQKTQTQTATAHPQTGGKQKNKNPPKNKNHIPHSLILMPQTPKNNEKETKPKQLKVVAPSPRDYYFR